jgi:hypothetical protein
MIRFLLFDLLSLVGVIFIFIVFDLGSVVSSLLFVAYAVILYAAIYGRKKKDL